MAAIASLHIYPVKSCRGIDVDSALVTPTGLEWDRRWMIVDANDRFITQRSHPMLATIGTALDAGELTLSADGRPPIAIAGAHDGERRTVVVWNDTCLGIDAGPEAAGWLSDHLRMAVRLVRIDPSEPRLAEPEWAGPRPHEVAFSDAYPLLLISTASLEDLNRRLPAPLPMNRFRPNVVIAGVEAYAEDAMALFHCGPVVIRGVKLCTRCAIPTTDQFDGKRDPEQEPIRTLKTYRNDRRLKGVTFGQNCVIESGIGERLAVATPVTIG